VPILTTPIRTAVIGVGYLGKFHANKYAQLPHATLVAVVDPNPLVCQAIAEQYQAVALSDYTQLLGQVDAVSIATPTPTHFTIAQFFLRHGVHVLIEKPITTTVAEATQLIQLAQQHQCILQVGHLERFNPALTGLQQWLHHPRMIESHRVAPFKLRGTDVNVVLDMMIHDIDIILSCIPSPIRHIHASGARILSNDLDVVAARIEFINGCVANLTANRVSKKTERIMHVYQEENYLTLDFQQATLSVYKKNHLDVASQAAHSHEVFQFENKDALLAEINAFLLAIKQGTIPIVSGEEGQRALEVAMHISSLAKESTHSIKEPLT